MKVYIGQRFSRSQKCSPMRERALQAAARARIRARAPATDSDHGWTADAVAVLCRALRPAGSSPGVCGPVCGANTSRCRQSRSNDGSCYGLSMRRFNRRDESGGTIAMPCGRCGSTVGLPGEILLRGLIRTRRPRRTALLTRRAHWTDVRPSPSGRTSATQTGRTTGAARRSPRCRQGADVSEYSHPPVVRPPRRRCTAWDDRAPLGGTPCRAVVPHE